MVKSIRIPRKKEMTVRMTTRTGMGEKRERKDHGHPSQTKRGNPAMTGRVSSREDVHRRSRSQIKAPSKISSVRTK
jgi:hypothetical protein